MCLFPSIASCSCCKSNSQPGRGNMFHVVRGQEWLLVLCKSLRKGHILLCLLWPKDEWIIATGLWLWKAWSLQTDRPVLTLSSYGSSKTLGSSEVPLLSFLWNVQNKTKLPTRAWGLCWWRGWSWDIGMSVWSTQWVCKPHWSQPNSRGTKPNTMPFFGYLVVSYIIKT